MKYLNTAELQAAYAGGAVLSVTLLPDGDEFEVRLVTAGGDFVLVTCDERQPMRFHDAPQIAVVATPKPRKVNLTCPHAAGASMVYTFAEVTAMAQG